MFQCHYKLHAMDVNCYNQRTKYSLKRISPCHLPAKSAMSCKAVHQVNMAYKYLGPPHLPKTERKG